MDNAPTTPAPASAETLEQNFHAAVAAYKAVFDELKQAVADQKKLDELRPIIRRVTEAEAACEEAFKLMVPFHEHGKKILAYVECGNAWAKRVASLAAIGKDPLIPQYRRHSKGIFDLWKFAERPYAGLGYRTVTIEEWFDSMPRVEVVPFAIWPALLVAREPGEEAVYHAVIMQSKHKGLQQAGTDVRKKNRMLRRKRQAARL